MAKKISQLPAAPSAADTDQIELNQSGVSRRATRAQVLRPPSNETLDEFHQYRDAPPQFTTDFTFSEATSGRALIQINPASNTVKMTLPDATGLTGKDGWLCDVRVASGAFACSVEVAVTGQMGVQTGYGVANFDPEADEQFFGLNQATALNNVYSLYKRGGAYNWQLGGFRNAAVDDLTFDGPLHGGGSLKIQDEGSQILAAATTLDFRGDVAVTDQGSGVARVTITGGGGTGDLVTIVVHAAGDMRSTIQTALDAAETAFAGDGVPRIVRLQNGKSYLIDSFVTHNYRSVGRAGILLGSGVWLDLNGAELKAGNSTNMWVVATKNPLAGTREDQIRLYGGVINCDRANQSTTATGSTEEYGGWLFQNVSRAVVDNVTTINCTFYGGEALECDEGSRFTRLRAYGGFGDGYRFGVNDGSTELRDCFIEDVYSEDMEHQGATYSGGRSPPQGNPLLLNGFSCVANNLRCRNCGGGYKFEGIVDCQLGLVLFDGSVPSGQSDNASANSGIKFQGGSDSLECENNTCASIVALNCFAEGLRLTECTGISIGSYYGRNNVRGAGGRDEIRVEAGPNYIGHIHIKESNGDRGVLLDDTSPHAPRLSVGDMIVEDCTDTSNGAIDVIESNAAGATLLVNQLRIRGCAAGFDAVDFNSAGTAHIGILAIDTADIEGDVVEGTTITVGQFLNSFA